MASAKIIELVNSGVSQLKLELSARQVNQLIAYLELLAKWNKVYSLSAITDMEQMVIYHLFDGLSGVEHFADATSVLDVGSGMGVPGIILAIVYPKISIDLIDSNSKKCSFLRQVIIELKLKNATVLNKRVESISDTNKYDIITSRAFSNMQLFYELCHNMLLDGGRILAYKSSNINNELDSLSTIQWQIMPLFVPYLEAKRYLVSYNDTQSSN